MVKRNTQKEKQTTKKKENFKTKYYNSSLNSKLAILY